jgi:SpoVK/Ycf46/Vps4 family AAA+-type ATPase
MDKRTKKDLERLENLTNAERNLLKGLYGDMFGTSTTGSGSRKPVGRKTSEPTAADLLDEAYKKHKDPLADAKKALKEAQDLVARTEELSQGMMDSNKKKTDQLMENLGRTGEVTPDGAPQTAKQTDGDSGMPVQTATGGPAPAPEPEKPKEPEKDPMEELESLVGLTTIKEDVKELMAFVKIQKLRKDAGLKSVPVSLHLVFTGNPGTGKTTVARIIGRLYKQIGVLSQGQLVEVDRSGLVAGYVGQTALKTQEQIKKAMGGVLFIDEAYALAQKDDAFGQEAIDTVLKAMEDHRDDLVVIVAGYTKPMEKFINSNPGLKSRFNKYFEFPDYTIDELEAIFNLNCKKYDYIVEEDAQKQIRARIVSRKMQRQDNFANAREVRNMFEDIITNQARRVAAMENPTHDDMMLITVMDLSDDIGDKTDSKEIEKMEEAAKALPAPELELPGEEEPAEKPEETPEEPEKTAEDQ